ncbi:seminal metalloprotease 1 [Drosophila kikkawai]|uniref:Metalloendopeptidase n=1 Tax=Drosophila kikkawai TaxID=30033 RepID=A0A6P4JTN6_DROKI|nr:seminal metalloprotease 1 [Drosophila kikkawai]
MLGIKLALILFLSREVLSKRERDPEIRPGYYQGDILNRGIKFRNGIGNKIYHWPNATVHYVIQPNVFDEAHLAKIFEAMADIMSKSCVVFKLATKNELPFALNITGNNDGCNAMALGFRTSLNGINLEPYPIDQGCFRMGSILHEFLHALGFEHQHVAQNRDEYIRIEWENIDKEYFVNFVNEDKTTTWHGFGEPYDYDSVMHYVPLAFSRNGEPTIVALKEGNHRMGQRFEMSKTDIRKLNKMYKCHGHV